MGGQVIKCKLQRRFHYKELLICIDYICSEAYEQPVIIVILDEINLPEGHTFQCDNWHLRRRANHKLLCLKVQNLLNSDKNDA